MVYANDILLVAKSAPEATMMLSEHRVALYEKGLNVKEDRLGPWTNYPSQSIWASWASTRWLKPQANMTFFGPLLTLEHEGACAIEPSMLGPSVGRSWVWVLTWGAVVWHIADGRLGTAENTIARLARLCMHLRRP